MHKKYYSRAAAELAAGVTDAALWAKAMAEANDPNQITPLYLRLRARELQTVHLAKGVSAVAHGPVGQKLKSVVKSATGIALFAGVVMLCSYLWHDENTGRPVVENISLADSAPLGTTAYYPRESATSRHIDPTSAGSSRGEHLLSAVQPEKNDGLIEQPAAEGRDHLDIARDDYAAVPLSKPGAFQSPNQALPDILPGANSASDGFAPAMPLEHGASHYPPHALRMHQEGVVTLLVLVSPEGTASAVTIAKSSGFPELDQAALSDVRRWGYIPAQQGGQRVESEIQVPVRFSLNQL